jgi:DNA-binding transcriptional LysR family regulator
MVDYVALLLVTPLELAVMEIAPNIDLAVHGLDAEAITPKLEAGSIDLYVGIHGETERGMKAKSLFRETFSVLMRSKHPVAKKGLTPETYVSYPHVHVSPRRERGSVVSRALSEVGLERRVAVEVPYFSLVPALLRDTNLIATVPSRLADQLARDHGLSLLPPPVKLPRFEVCMAWHPRFEREPGLLWLGDLLSTVAGKL